MQGQVAVVRKGEEVGGGNEEMEDGTCESQDLVSSLVTMLHAGPPVDKVK